MTKRIFSLFLSALFVFSFSVVVYATDDCPHNFGYFEYEAVAPTCGKDGHIKYKECKLGCGQLTDTRRNPLTWDQIVSPATGEHVYGADGKCTVCGYGVDCDHEGGNATCCEKAVCSLCGESYGEYDYLNHTTDETELKNYLAPTCKTEGYSGNLYYVCCDTLKESGNSTGYADHEYSENVVEKDKDYHGNKCSVCGDYTNLTVHNWNLKSTITEAECTEDGLGIYVCAECDAEKEGTISATGHTEVVVKGTSATCTENGLTDGVKCSVCGEFTVKQEVILSSGHATETRQENLINATCGKDGSYDLVTYCATCNDVISTEHKVTPATGIHNFDTEVDGTKILPTCTADGSVLMKCTCGETKTVILPKNTDAHTWSSESVVVKNPTCTTKGETKYQCMNSGCNAYYTEETAIDNNAHKWSEWTVSYDSDCENTGLKVRVCEHNSSHKEQEIIQLKNHTAVFVSEKESTCTVKGNAAYWYCSVCSKKFADSSCKTEITNVELPFKAHSYSVYTYNNDATCNTDGTETSVCDICKVNTNTRIRLGTKLEHKYSSYVSDNNATCATDGTKIAVCDYCKTSHDTVTDIGSKDTVSHTPDVTGQMCTVCGKEFEGVHRWSSEKVVTESATCIDEGSKAIICLDCGAEKIGTSEVIPAVGHSYTDDWQILSAPTCKNDGLRVKVCKSCYFVLDEIMLKTEHYDADSDNICNACGTEIKAETADSSNNSSTENGTTIECTCNCHKTGFAKIIFSITNFFQKLFGINKVCACGEPH